MKSYVAVFILCVLEFILAQDAALCRKENPTPKTQPTRSTGYSAYPKSEEPSSKSQAAYESSSAVTPPGNTTKGPKGTGKVPPAYSTSSSYQKSGPPFSRGSSVSSSDYKSATPANPQPTRSMGYSTVSKSKGTVSVGKPTHTSDTALTPSYQTSSSYQSSEWPISRGSSASSSNFNKATPAKPRPTSSGRSTVPKSGELPTISSTDSQKTPPGNTGVPPSSDKRVPASGPTSSTTTSSQKPISPISRGTSPGNIPSSLAPPASTQTTFNSTTTPGFKTTGTPTLTVSNGETASVKVGMIVVGAGVGGSIIVGGSTFPIDGGTEVIIEENDTGQDGPVTISSDDDSTSPTRTQTTRTTQTTTTTTTTTTRRRRTSTTPKTSTSSSTSSSSSTTSSSTALPTPYNIYPSDGSTLSQQSAFAQNLEQIAQRGSVTSITGSRGRLLLWRASLTPAQASELSRNAVVRGLNPDRSLPVERLEEPRTATPTSSPNCPPENCSRKRDGSILMQQNAPDDLKMFSQARGAPLSSLPGYAYDARGGRGITVYVIDSGINPNHAEFRGMLGSLRWLYLPGDTQVEGDVVGHGACVASKITGPTIGVAKSADLVIVKVSGGLSVSRIFAAWGVVAADIYSGGRSGKAVIVNSMGVKPTDITPNDRLTYIECLRDVIGLDVVIVVASGNINAIVPGVGLALYPALFASEIGLPVIIVGAVDTSGIYASYSQGLASDLTVSAVGAVVCASHLGGLIHWSGTSFAAPAVAGLAAYLMSLDRYEAQIQVPGSVAINVRNLIQSLAYPRRALQPAVVWNGIDSRDIYFCPVRRDTGTSGCPARNTSSIPMSSSTTTAASSSSAMVNEPITTVPSSSGVVTDSTDTLASSSTVVIEPTTTLAYSSSIITEPTTTTSTEGELTIITTSSGVSSLASEITVSVQPSQT